MSPIQPTSGEKMHSAGPRRVEAELITDAAREQRLEQLRSLSNLMDGGFHIPGTKIEFGWDSIIGLVPGVGDAVAAAVSAWIIREGRRLGAPRRLVARMIWNVAVDAGIGIVPVVGDAFDVAWKANRKNVALLTRYFEKQRRR